MVRVRYAPLAPRHSLRHLHHRHPGGSDVRLTCLGRSDGPAVSFRERGPAREKDGLPQLSRPSSLQFGDIRIGGVTSRVVYWPTTARSRSVPVRCRGQGDVCSTVPSGVIPQSLRPTLRSFLSPKSAETSTGASSASSGTNSPPSTASGRGTRTCPGARPALPCPGRRAPATAAGGKGALSPAELEELLASNPEWLTFARSMSARAEGARPGSPAAGRRPSWTRDRFQFFEPQCGQGGSGNGAGVP